MAPVPISRGADFVALQNRSCALLSRAAAEDTHGNVLLLVHPLLSRPELPCLRRDEHSFGLAIALHTGTGRECRQEYSPVVCDSHSLPFQDATFRTVALFHALADGHEPELEEAARVLAANGQMLILGLGGLGWSGWAQRRVGALPVLRLARLRTRLQQLQMVIESRHGAGLMGREAPWLERGSWRSLLLPVADLVLLSVRHRERLESLHRSRKSLRAGVLPSALRTG